MVARKNTSRGWRRPAPVNVLAGEDAQRELRRIALAQDRLSRQGGPHPFRFRWQLVPAAWVAVMAAGLIARRWQVDAVTVAGVAAVPCGAAVLAVRGRDRFTRLHVQTAAGWAWLWMIVGAGFGAGWWTAIGLAGWAIPAGFWVNHYSWRPAGPEQQRAETDAEIFAELAELQKWHARLGVATPIENGVQYPVICNGRRTPIIKITGKPDEIAAAFGTRTDEAYVEPDPSGDADKGVLTRLRSATLEEPREWDGSGIDMASGTARIGRYPDGRPVREMFWLPGKGGGVKHSWLSGCDGSGKTSLIDLSLCIAVTSRGPDGRGVIAPFVLDPQAGQALPAWQGHVPYASGIDECMLWLAGLHKAMFARSEYLAGLEWKLLADKKTAVRPDDPRPGKIRKGIGFFDPVICDLPIIEITIDECPILLAVQGAENMLTDIAKLGRKAGFRLRMAAQVPSVREMKSAELRSILNGGNQAMFRAGDRVSGGMMNMPADPFKIAKFFRNGKATFGLGYASTPDNRPGVAFRADYEPDPYEVAETADIRSPDRLTAETMRAVIEAADASAGQLRRLADDQAAVQLLLLQALADGPVPVSGLVAVTGCKPSAVAAALKAMAAQGDVARDGDMVSAR